LLLLLRQILEIFGYSQRDKLQGRMTSDGQECLIGDTLYALYMVRVNFNIIFHQLSVVLGWRYHVGFAMKAGGTQVSLGYR
jgi:hypothetical protein